MDSSPRPAPSGAIGRRTLFGLVGASALGALVGCSGLTPEAETITVTTSAAAPAAPIMALIFKTRLHIEHLAAAAASDHPEHELFGALLADRQAHVAALETENERLSGQPTPPAAQAGGVPIPEDPDEVTALIRSDAGQAQNMFTDATAGSSRYQAQLFATIAASIATHRAVLS